MPNPHPNADDASLYVLDLLDPEAKRAFEAELDASPDLRRHVSDLSANLDALAEAMPPVHPPARVWAAIADRTASGMVASAARTPGPWAVAWGLLRSWLVNGWAVAALVTAAFVTHLLLDPPLGSVGDMASVDAENAAAGGRSGAGTEPRAGAGGAREQGPGLASRAGGAADRSRTPASNAGSRIQRDQEEARLQDRVRSLSEQVTMLTRMLTQQTVLPSGASRLQVFRLVGTNGTIDTLDALNPDPRRGMASNPLGTGTGAGSGTTRPPVTSGTGGGGTSDPTGTLAGVTGSGAGAGTGEAATPDVALALALAAARQLAALPVSTGDGTASPLVRNRDTVDAISSGFAPPALTDPVDSVVTPVESASGRETIRVIDLAQSESVPNAGLGAGLVDRSSVGLAPSGDGSAFGAFSPDTGQGAVAFRVPSGVGEDGVLQLWVSDAQTGVMQSLGTTTLSASVPVPQVMVMRFNVGATAFTTPTFMITREPAGGSVVPTGPVVALPPSPTVPNP